METFILLSIDRMAKQFEFDGDWYVLADEYDELKEENKELKSKLKKVIELFEAGDEFDLYDYIADLDYEED